MTSSLSPIADADWPDEIADMRQGFAGTLNVYRIMAHHPLLLRAWAPLRQHVVKNNALGPARTEIVILRAAHRMGSPYEWAHHVSRSRALGMSDARIAAIAGRPDGDDGLLVRAVDALFDLKRLPGEIEAELSGAVGRHGVLDLIAIVGFYSVLGYILMTYDTPLDADVAAELTERPLGMVPAI
jgi:4-carboxymuconolactone decarboxylase